MEPISLRAYAKHRAAAGLSGTSAMAVSTAVRTGRLHESIVRDVNGDPKVADVALADLEWERNTLPPKRPPETFDGGARLPSLIGAKPPKLVDHDPADRFEGVASATERLKSAQADLAELKRDEARGELVPAKDVERRLTEVFAACRTKLLALPTRARQALPHLTTTDLAELERLTRETCEDLAGGKA